jgi:hypothetical protein
MAEEDFLFSDETTEPAEPEEESFDFEDEFDRLRQKTARTSAVFDEMELEEGYEEEQPEGFFAQISAGQRIILLVLLFVDIVAVGIGVLAVLGQI